MADPVKIYFAAPLFTQAEWQWNQRLAEALRRLGCEVALPQDAAWPTLSGETAFDAAQIFRMNLAAMKAADIVLAVLDQPDPDSGTSWECGYAYHAGKPVIGLRTDLRLSGDGPDSAVNLMIAECCAALIVLPPSNREDLMAVAEAVCDAIPRSLIHHREPAAAPAAERQA